MIKTSNLGVHLSFTLFVAGEIHRQAVLYVWSDVHRPDGVLGSAPAPVVHYGIPSQF